MTPAPPFDCAACGRRIGKTASHRMLDYPNVSADRIICAGCAVKHARKLHARFYPHCPHDWHDLFDHHACSASRAAAARLLGLWPTRKEHTAWTNSQSSC